MIEPGTARKPALAKRLASQPVVLSGTLSNHGAAPRPGNDAPPSIGTES